MPGVAVGVTVGTTVFVGVEISASDKVAVGKEERIGSTVAVADSFPVASGCKPKKLQDNSTSATGSNQNRRFIAKHFIFSRSVGQLLAGVHGSGNSYGVTLQVTT